ncbi:FAS1 domain-containing protein [Chaetomium fimeti]|uniref:FAS1 domain-containing protein n=1 Tax=Chaetomium fimeti TaxID=1854472 RepID=A0AAE0HDN3_9PEZI|nr:FAS1 domain-containing protein [Chaetomium fimeti]
MKSPFNMATLYALALAALLSFTVLADPLLPVLQQEGFTEFARELQGAGGEVVLNACRNMIIYAPTNAALAQRGTCSLARRNDNTTAWKTQYAAPGQEDYGDKRRAEITTTPGAISRMNLLSHPQFVNLGPGQNSSIIEKNVPNAAFPVVLSGLGESVKVTGLDIPYDCGVIRPVSGLFTLPRPLSETLPFLGLDDALAALQETGLLSNFDNRASITFLAPDDSVFPDGISGEELAQVLRGHLLQGPPAYTPLLVDGATYTTLAGTTVTVTVEGPDFFIGGARILAGDAVIKNGVIHTIDKLVVASGTAATPTTPATGTGVNSPIATAAGVKSDPSSVYGLVSVAVAVAIGYIL